MIESAFLIMILVWDFAGYVDRKCVILNFIRT